MKIELNRPIELYRWIAIEDGCGLKVSFSKWMNIQDVTVAGDHRPRRG